MDSILVVDDDAAIREILADRLESMGYQVTMAANGREGLEAMEREPFPIVLLDIEMPGMNGLEVLREIKRGAHDVAVIMITAYATVERAIQAMKEGAFDFIPKPFEPDHVALIVSKAFERQRLKKDVEFLTEQVDERHRLIPGQSEAINHALDVAKKAAAAKSTVLLLGESGAGKEIFARAIHNWSDRRAKPFVPINCVGLSKDLLESELFGHEKGAFTGATQLKKGKMEIAHGGTVFLDEVGDISTELQTKLLRFLQEREFERVGGSRPIGVDVRIIAATNRDLEAAVQAGQFREDLFYRLNVVALTLPPLRERKKDIVELATYFLAKFAGETKKKFTEISEEARSLLMRHDWPGNVRELANVIERAVVLGQGPILMPKDLRLVIATRNAENREEKIALEENFSEDNFSSAKGLTLPAAVERLERQLIEACLRANDGNQRQSAIDLGLSRQGLIKKMKRYDIGR